MMSFHNTYSSLSCNVATTRCVCVCTAGLSVVLWQWYHCVDHAGEQSLQ